MPRGQAVRRMPWTQSSSSTAPRRATRRRKAVFDRYIDSLSSACASIYNLLDPEVIAIGGGVCGAGEFLFAPLRERTTGKCFYKTHGKLIPAELGNDAGMIGAAMLHRDAQ